MTWHDQADCVACGSDHWIDLPVPGARSMASDGRVIDRKLKKRECTSCGLVTHTSPPPATEVATLFGDHYSLYAHPPGGVFEVERQRGYARWIFEAISNSRPADVFEVGCGNGSLLLALRDLLPHARLRGIDPSPEAVRFARDAGVEVGCGFVGQADYRPPRADIVVCVNVLEHNLDPVAFLKSMCGAFVSGDRAVVICPDGSVPSTELLVYDHFFSFTEEAFRQVAARAGLEIVASSPAPNRLGRFRLYMLERAVAPARNQASIDATLLDGRVRYLRAWEALDDELLRRIGTAPSLACFGLGETALLLRAYAPRTWTRIAQFMIDHPALESFDGRPVKSLGDASLTSDDVVLLAVRPLDQERVHERLLAAHPRLVRWDDCITD